MVKRLNESAPQTDDFIYEAVLQSIDDKINEVFLEFQDRYGIVSGDVEPTAQFDLSTKEEELANIVVEILKYQYEIN